MSELTEEAYAVLMHIRATRMVSADANIAVVEDLQDRELIDYADSDYVATYWRLTPKGQAAFAKDRADVDLRIVDFRFGVDSEYATLEAIIAVIRDQARRIAELEARA